MLLSAPILPLCTSPQGSDEGDEEEDYENGENINNNSQEGEDTGQTQKWGCTLLQDMLEEEAGRKKRKPGIIK